MTGICLSVMPASWLLALSIGHSTTSKPTKDFPEIDERRTLHELGLLPLVGSQMFGAMS